MQTLQCRFCAVFKKLDQEAQHPTLTRRLKTAYSISSALIQEIGSHVRTMATLIALAHEAQWRSRETEFATCLTGRNCQDELDWDRPGAPPLSNLLHQETAWR